MDSGAHEQDAAVSGAERAPEVEALKTALHYADAAIAAKDQELNAKQEMITLLREKVRELERVSRDGVDFLAPLREPVASRESRGAQSARPAAKAPAGDAPKSAWARFYKWFREA